MIFGQIQGDYSNFTMAAVAAMLNFSAGSQIFFDFYMSQRIFLPNLVLIDATVCQILTQ